MAIKKNQVLVPDHIYVPKHEKCGSEIDVNVCFSFCNFPFFWQSCFLPNYLPVGNLVDPHHRRLASRRGWQSGGRMKPKQILAVIFYPVEVLKLLNLYPVEVLSG